MNQIKLSLVSAFINRFALVANTNNKLHVAILHKAKNIAQAQWLRIAVAKELAEVA